MRLFSRRTVLVLGLGGVAALPGRSRAADVQTVAAPIATLDNALLGIMKAGKATPFTQRYQTIAPIIRRVFDLTQILQVSVGPSWNSMSTQQQGLLLGEFERYTVANYVSNFDNYNGQRFEIAPTLRPIGADQVVQTTLISATDQTRIDYVMRGQGGGWRVVDVLLDGTISRVAVQRSDFRSTLASGGAPGLIALLQQKVSQLSGGAMT